MRVLIAREADKLLFQNKSQPRACTITFHRHMACFRLKWMDEYVHSTSYYTHYLFHSILYLSNSYFFCQILYDPSPTPPRDFSLEFCSFIDACLQKDPNARPTAEQVPQIEFCCIVCVGLVGNQFEKLTMFHIVFLC